MPIAVLMRTLHDDGDDDAGMYAHSLCCLHACPHGMYPVHVHVYIYIYVEYVPKISQTYVHCEVRALALSGIGSFTRPLGMCCGGESDRQRALHCSKLLATQAKQLSPW